MENNLFAPNTGLSVIQEQVSDLEEITYANLVEKRNQSQLTPGKKYRITDYITTTVQEETQSAGNQFDIVATALSEDTLDENARCLPHEGDTYFQNSNLAAWEIKYCLDNDTNKFEWADEINGKGVIYYMKDENENECPYDFKNIRFKRYKITAFSSCPSLVGKYLGYIYSNSGYPSGATFGSGDYEYVYTFDSNNNDYTLNGKYCFGNIIKFYAVTDKRKLNNIVFVNTGTSSCDSNTFSINCSYYSFANGCSNNTFGSNCGGNIFGNGCSSNIFGNNCTNNTFGNNCNKNTFGNNCTNNTFGNNCNKNTFGNDCNRNTFGNSCINNTFDSSCGSNTFGNYCNYNTFDSGCISNTFGNYCENNVFGNSCSNNRFGSGCISNRFGNDCRYNVFGNYCTSNTFGNSCWRIIFGEGDDGEGCGCGCGSCGCGCGSCGCGCGSCGCGCGSCGCGCGSCGCGCGSCGCGCGGGVDTHDYYRYIRIDDGNTHINITKFEICQHGLPWVQNVHVALGVSTSANPVTIPLTNLEDLDAKHVIEVTKHSALTIYVD